MEAWQRECSIVDARIDCNLVRLKENGGQGSFTALVKTDSPIGLRDLFKIDTWNELIGEEVTIDLMLKRLYPKGSCGRKDFVRCNFQIF